MKTKVDPLLVYLYARVPFVFLCEPTDALKPRAPIVLLALIAKILAMRTFPEVFALIV